MDNSIFFSLGRGGAGRQGSWEAGRFGSWGGMSIKSEYDFFAGIAEALEILEDSGWEADRLGGDISGVTRPYAHFRFGCVCR